MTLKFVVVLCLIGLIAAGDYEYKQPNIKFSFNATQQNDNNNYHTLEHSQQISTKTDTSDPNYEYNDNNNYNNNNNYNTQSNTITVSSHNEPTEFNKNSNRNNNYNKQSQQDNSVTVTSNTYTTEPAYSHNNKNNLQGEDNLPQITSNPHTPTQNTQNSAENDYRTRQFAAPADVASQDFPPAKYDFHYSVHDDITGDIKEHSESRDGNSVHGSYSLVDPDGFKRTVTYTADDVHGFRAIVKREPIAFSRKTEAVSSKTAAVLQPVVELQAPLTIAAANSDKQEFRANNEAPSATKSGETSAEAADSYIALPGRHGDGPYP